MTRQYYILRFERDDSLHKSGDQVFNADNALRIGQTSNCDVKLPNLSQFEDAVLAVIEKRPGDQGWKLIRTSPYMEHEVRVNGAPVDYVHFLDDGDRISFEGIKQELTFNIRNDEQYLSDGIVTNAVKSPLSRALQIWLSVITIAILAGITYYLYARPMTEGMMEDAKQSVFMIKVDSVKLISIRDGETTVLKSQALGSPISSVAFLTTDTLLVTARHCIEPWLNVAKSTNMTPDSDYPERVKWALEATTHNIMVDDSTWWDVISVCSVYRLDPTYEKLFTVSSSDFFMNKSRDLIIEYGDLDHQYFWRSISGTKRRIDMMLGDIAYYPVSKAEIKNNRGNIRLASKLEMFALCKKPQRKITIMGCPEDQLNTPGAVPQIDVSEDKLRKALEFDDNGYPDIVIAHNGQITPGFSGGPVLTKMGFFGYRVIGVVSVTDEKNKNRCYSVPVTEIEVMQNNPQQH